MGSDLVRYVSSNDGASSTTRSYKLKCQSPPSEPLDVCLQLVPEGRAPSGPLLPPCSSSPLPTAYGVEQVASSITS